MSNDIQILMVILDEVKAIRQDNAEFKSSLKQDMQTFKAEMRSDMQTFKAEIKEELSGIHAEIGQLQKDTTRIQADLNWLLHIDYWLITVIVAIFVLPHVINSVTAIFKAVVESIREITRIFKGKSDV